MHVKIISGNQSGICAFADGFLRDTGNHLRQYSLLPVKNLKAYFEKYKGEKENGLQKIRQSNYFKNR